MGYQVIPVKFGPTTQPQLTPRRAATTAVAWQWRGKNVSGTKNPIEGSPTGVFTNPDGDSGLYRAHGGRTRDADLNAPDMGEWGPSNFDAEISDMLFAGMDSIWMDCPSPRHPTSGEDNYQRYKNFAARAKLVNLATPIMPDINGGAFNGIPGTGTTSAMTPQAAAQGCAAFYEINPTMTDGAWWVSSYKADGSGDAKSGVGTIANLPADQYWNQFLAEIRQLVPVPVKFCGLVLHPNNARWDSVMSVSDMMSWWGPARAGRAFSTAQWALRTKAAGKMLCDPIRFQDVRNRDGSVAEPNNTQLLRDMFNQAETNLADWVQVPTWNDKDESTHLSRTFENNICAAVLFKRFVEPWKARQPLTAQFDEIFLTNRRQLAATLGSLSGLEPNVFDLDGGGTPRDMVGALCFVTQPGTTISINGGSPQPIAVGVNEVLGNLVLGQVQTAQLIRNGSVIASVSSLKAPTANPYVQDHSYKINWSGLAA